MSKLTFIASTILFGSAAAFAAGASAATAAHPAAKVAKAHMTAPAKPHEKLTCAAAPMTPTSVEIRFQNMGDAAMPAGSKIHWRLSGMAQGDYALPAALAPKAETKAAFKMPAMAAAPAPAAAASKEAPKQQAPMASAMAAAPCTAMTAK